MSTAQPPRRNLSRRSFLSATVATAVTAACTSSGDTSATPSTGATPTPTTAPVPTPTPAPVPAPAIELPGDPFTLGVASGDPLPDSVIVWTRLAPDPLAGGGMPDDDVEVAWDIAGDPEFTDIVGTGTAPATAALGHALHLDATGLEPATEYWYRFRIGEFVSPTGRTRTLPATDASPDDLRFAFVSCQDYQAGFYAAYRHMLDDDLHFVVHLGDYIYEDGPGEFAGDLREVDARLHRDGETVTLDDYRNRYALYRTDPDLVAAHQRYPFVITWDDHEVDNDYADDTSENFDPPTEFLERRAVAYQAWYEHMPVRLDAPTGPDYVIHRDFAYGDLAHFWVLDTRQYRDDQPVPDEPFVIPGIEDNDLPIALLEGVALDPSRTILGAEQKAWLLEGTATADATWTVLAQQVFMFGANALPGSTPPLVITDTWDGYSVERAEVLTTMTANGVENLVVITGDLHTAAAADLKADPFDPDSPVVGAEFLGTSITSVFPEAVEPLAQAALLANPHIKHFDSRKGYCRCTVNRELWRTDYQVVSDVLDPGADNETAATFVARNGVPGAEPG
ncbi:MAG: alkaline phosphatase D family protein [Acidimicrobiia bacterium]|nr:alkaline phosphatase D family protein [Acidimicrobiia bacterium]